MAPDPRSRTPTRDGRRIIPLLNDQGGRRAFGWRLTNYQKYRAITNEAERREYKAQWDRTNRPHRPDRARQRSTNPTASDSTRQQPTHTEGKGEGETKKSRKAARTHATPPPADFEVSERVKTWAQQKGYTSLEAYLEWFTGRMRANGKRYADWDAAFQNCVREDWPGFRKAAGTADAAITPKCALCVTNRFSA